jgi:hypothetical protein
MSTREVDRKHRDISAIVRTSACFGAEDFFTMGTTAFCPPDLVGPFLPFLPFLVSSVAPEASFLVIDDVVISSGTGLEVSPSHNGEA